jgi:hypothetical protein
VEGISREISDRKRSWLSVPGLSHRPAELYIAWNAILRNCPLAKYEEHSWGIISKNRSAKLHVIRSKKYSKRVIPESEPENG